MTTLIVGALCLLLAHLVCDAVERRRLAAVDDDAASRALHAVDPEFAAELGYVPPKPAIRNGALAGLIAGLHEQQKSREGFALAQRQRDALAAIHRAAGGNQRFDPLAGMMQAPPPNAYAQFSNEMNAQYKNSLLAQMMGAAPPHPPKGIRPSGTIGGMFGRHL